MKFARIEMLFLIWTVPVLFLVFLYGMNRRRKILGRFASVRGLKAIAPDTGKNRRRIKAGLLLVAVALMAVALSGPRYGYQWQETERRGIDIIIALDCSRSMLAGDIRPTRLDRAKREIYDLLTMLEGDRVGLVAFAGTAFLQCPLTLDYQAFHLFLNTLTPDFLPVGGTDMGQALQTALAGFDEKTNSEKAVILITDGENTGADDPIRAAEAAKEADVKLFCIGVGSEGGVPVPDAGGGFKKDRNGKIIVTRLDQDTLKKMAILTGGTYVRSVAGDMDLDVIYAREIRGKMKQATLASGRKQVWEDRYQWVLALAVVALLIEAFLSSARPVSKAVLLLLLFPAFFTSPAHADSMRDGLAAYDQGDYEKALKLFIDAQLDDPENPRILYNIGNTYYRLGDYEAAARNFEAARKTEDPQLKHKTLYNLGNADFRRQQFEEAIEHYMAALELAPQDTQAKQNIEFVKKVMEMQKQKKENPSQCDQKQDKDKESEKKDSSQNQKGDKSGDQKEKSEDQQKKGDQKKTGQDKPSPQYGKEKPDEDQPPETPQPSPGDEKKEDAQDARAKKPGASDPDADAKKQAERILNRLKDQPGRAMMPAYGEHHVEKDW